MESIIGITSGIIGIFSAVFSFYSWARAKGAEKTANEALAEAREKERMLSLPVSIKLVSDSEELTLPYSPLRRELSRQEVAGVIGMYAGGRRYDIPGLSQVYASGEYTKVLKGENDILVVPCPDTELALFKAKVAEFKKANAAE